MEKNFLRRYSNMLTNIKSLSKKIYYYSEFANNKKNLPKTREIIRSVMPHKSTHEPPITLKVMITLPMTLTPLQINLIITFAQLALTWQISEIVEQLKNLKTS